MCFSPQRRAIFQHLNFKKWSEAAVFCTFSLQNVLLATTACNFAHLNFKKWSEHAVFCTFWLQNVLLATAACNFSTSQLPKVLRECWCASRHSGVQFLISPLTTWLRTRRFNEPTFRLTRHTNHWKNTASRDFSNIWRGWIFFLLTFALLQLLSSDSTSSSDFTFLWLYFIYLLFICFSTLHIVGSLLFKLPSITTLYYHYTNKFIYLSDVYNVSMFSQSSNLLLIGFRATKTNLRIYCFIQWHQQGTPVLSLVQGGCPTNRWGGVRKIKREKREGWKRSFLWLSLSSSRWRGVCVSFL